MSPSQSLASRSALTIRSIAIYALMIAGSVGAIVLICHYGQSLSAPAAAGTQGANASSATASGHGEALFHVLLALVAVIIVGRVMGRLLQFAGQPPVIGEVLAGIMLGPSLLGRLAPEASAFILPASAAPHLSIIAQLAVIFYMFLVGLQLDTSKLRERGQAAVAISHASIALPMLLGTTLALWLYPRLSSGDVPFVVFGLFVGISLSVTAFPVLARILTDRRIERSPLGVLALTCAAADDLTAWCLLALVVGVAQARVDSALWVVIWSLAYLAFMLLVLRPVLARLTARYRSERLSQGTMALVIVALLLSAMTTHWIGVHAVFGAFLLGAVIPHGSTISRQVPEKIHDLVTVALLPAFFAFTGMRTQIDLVAGPGLWLICGLIILVATVGKFGGTLVAARCTGLGWREASALGILMNTRGLMELIVLNIGLDLGVISHTLYAMLVLMALVTTLATTPLLHFIWRPVPADERATETGGFAPPQSSLSERDCSPVPAGDGLPPITAISDHRPRERF